MILNYSKRFFWLFGSTCIPLLKMSRHNNVKIYNAFSRQNFMSYLRQRILVSLNWYDVAKGGTIMNYAKKIVIFITMYICLLGLIHKIRRLHRIHTFWDSILSYSDTTLNLKVYNTYDFLFW